MQVKIDTSERFHVITILERTLSANMTELLQDRLSQVLNKEVKNVVLNGKDIESLDNAVAETLLKLQELFYNQKASFVICCLQSGVIKQLSDWGLLEKLNTTPTQSEAADIVQMEEIERELDL